MFTVQDHCANFIYHVLLYYAVTIIYSFTIVLCDIWVNVSDVPQTLLSWTIMLFYYDALLCILYMEYILLNYSFYVHCIEVQYVQICNWSHSLFHGHLPSCMLHIKSQPSLFNKYIDWSKLKQCNNVEISIPGIQL